MESLPQKVAAPVEKQGRRLLFGFVSAIFRIVGFSYSNNASVIKGESMGSAPRSAQNPF